MPPASPPPCVLEHWSSAEVDPTIRLDYWHDVAHNWVEVQPLSPEEELEASWSLLRNDTCLFGTKRSTAYEMRTGSKHVPAGEDMVVLSLLEAGELRLNAAPGENQHVTAGMLGLYAPQQEGCYRFSDGARQTYVALPRTAVVEALGREPGNLLLPPQRCVLAPLLSSQLGHLSLLARQPGRLNAQEYAALLDATRALTLLTLRNLGRHQGDGGDLLDLNESLHAGRVAAAVRFMEHNAHRHDLDAAAIAQGSGCSRTRLYEAFATQDTTVMATLRELRLQRARRLIEQSPRLHVGALAWRCGFADQSGFSGLFRARFGLPPSEWHRQAWAASRV